MSKSLGNMILARELVSKYGQNLLRLYLFSTHYREEIDYKENDLVGKKTLLEKIYKANHMTSDQTSKNISNLMTRFFTSFEDDLNSPKALDAFDEICSAVLENDSISTTDFMKIISVLGLSI